MNKVRSQQEESKDAEKKSSKPSADVDSNPAKKIIKALNVFNLFKCNTSTLGNIFNYSFLVALLFLLHFSHL